MKSFESWTYEDVELTFDIKQKYKYELLNKWLEADNKPNEYVREHIETLKNDLLKNVNAWNEDELKMQFIAPLINIVHFATDLYKPFSQRSLTLKTKDIEVSGIVDFMIAKGKVRPKEPYFFLHEYKQQHPSKKNDPLGQLLISMVAAQLINNNNNPIYGVLVEGRSWYFVVLHQKEYAVSGIFDACEDDIYKIYAILCKAKEYINKFIVESEELKVNV